MSNFFFLISEIMSATLNGKVLVDRSLQGKPRNYQDQILWSRELQKEINEELLKIWEHTQNLQIKFDILSTIFLNPIFNIFETLTLIHGRRAPRPIF